MMIMMLINVDEGDQHDENQHDEMEDDDEGCDPASRIPLAKCGSMFASLSTFL